MSANDVEKARTLFSCIPALQRPCDLDLLMFFAKHPRSLLSSEQLARMLGYPLTEIAQSRDILLAAGLLTRRQSPTRGARLYVFTPGGASGESLSAVIDLAYTRKGRLALRRALMPNRADGTRGLSTQARDDATAQPSTPPPSALALAGD